jgi:2-dehydropantoate 2-reductase
MLQKQRYLIVGSGRIARHFAHYFQTLGLGFGTWDRSWARTYLQAQLDQSTHVLLLISDSAIENFHHENLSGFSGTVVHCSGALEIPGVHSVHPLMTFAADLYEPSIYPQIPFVTTSSLSADELIPELKNAVYRIRPDQKSYYHALCVMSGNFTTLLWQKMHQGLRELGLPNEIEAIYRQQIFKNLSGKLSEALTGPLTRKDLATVVRNDQALTNDNYQFIYRAFLKAHFPEALAQLEGAK